jgi:hypothetical protein
MTTATPELPDFPLEELTFNPRTQRALAAAGIRTADDLEKALSADGIPGVGPKGLDEIEHAIEQAFDSEESRADAAAVILRAHGRLSELIMMTTDLAVGISNGADVGLKEGHAIEGSNMRAAAGRTLRESFRDTYEALRILAPELPERDWTVVA